MSASRTRAGGSAPRWSPVPAEPREHREHRETAVGDAPAETYATRRRGDPAWLVSRIGVTTAGRSLFRTSTATAVPFLCDPFLTYPIAMFFPSEGEGIPDVTVPVCEGAEASAMRVRTV